MRRQTNVFVLKASAADELLQRFEFVHFPARMIKIFVEKDDCAWYNPVPELGKNRLL